MVSAISTCAVLWNSIPTAIYGSSAAILLGFYMKARKAYLERDGASMKEYIKYRDTRYTVVTIIILSYILQPGDMIPRVTTLLFITVVLIVSFSLWLPARKSMTNTSKAEWIFSNHWTARLFRASHGLIYTPPRRLCISLSNFWGRVADIPGACHALTNQEWMDMEEVASREQGDRLKNLGATMFQHELLKRGEIRLLKIEPALSSPGGLVRCSMEHAQFHAKPDYTAVSYRWGDTSLSSTILVDERLLSVTKSVLELFFSRRRFLSANETRLYWIDAICINQADTEEKTVQVQAMRSIFQSATEVMVHLGNSPLERTAAEMLFEQAEAFTYLGLSDSFDPWRLSRNINRQHIKSIMWLLTNRYFTRAWIVQEMLSGRKVTFYFGGLCVPWAIFAAAICRILPKHGPTGLIHNRADGKNYQPHHSPLYNIRTIVDLKPESENKTQELRTIPKDRCLETLLFVSSRFRATDPRDLIFAFSGIATDYHDCDLLRPDYQKPIERVFEDFAVYLLVHQRPAAVNIFALAGRGYNHERRKVPTWVPDPSEARYGEMFSISNPHEKEGPCFEASGHSTPCVRTGGDRKTIVVEGVIRDSLVSLSACKYTKKAVRATQKGAGRYDFLLAAFDLIVAMENGPPVSWQKSMVDDLFNTLLTAASLIANPHLKSSQMPEASYFEYMNLTQQHVARDLAERIFLYTLQDVPEPKLAGFASFDRMALGRLFGITKARRFCFVPPLANVNDVVFVPSGAQVPYLIRPSGSIDGQETWELVGEAYVQGIMMGEGFDEGEKTMITLQ